MQAIHAMAPYTVGPHLCLCQVSGNVQDQRNQKAKQGGWAILQVRILFFKNKYCYVPASQDILDADRYQMQV